MDVLELTDSRETSPGESATDEQLEHLAQARQQNDNRLKNQWENIFIKYGRDFSEVGDEIDIETGDIVVNNGHIERMRNEVDPGTGEDENDAYSWEDPGSSPSDDDDPDGEGDEDEDEDGTGSDFGIPIDASGSGYEDGRQPLQVEDTYEKHLQSSLTAMSRPAPRLAHLLVGQNAQRPIDLTLDDNNSDGIACTTATRARDYPLDRKPDIARIKRSASPNARVAGQVDESAIQALGVSIANQLATLLSINGNGKTTKRKWRRDVDPLWDFPEIELTHQQPKKRVKVVDFTSNVNISPNRHNSLWAPSRGPGRPRGSKSMIHRRPYPREPPLHEDDVDTQDDVDDNVCPECGLSEFSHRDLTQTKDFCSTCNLSCTHSKQVDQPDGATIVDDLGIVPSEVDPEMDSDEDELLYSANTSRQRSTGRNIPYSLEEDIAIIKLREYKHLTWTEIAPRLRDRTANAIKVRYNKHLRVCPSEARTLLDAQGSGAQIASKSNQHVVLADLNNERAAKELPNPRDDLDSDDTTIATHISDEISETSQHCSHSNIGRQGTQNHAGTHRAQVKANESMPNTKAFPAITSATGLQSRGTSDATANTRQLVTINRDRLASQNGSKSTREQVVSPDSLSLPAQPQTALFQQHQVDRNQQVIPAQTPKVTTSGPQQTPQNVTRTKQSRPYVMKWRLPQQSATTSQQTPQTAPKIQLSQNLSPNNTAQTSAQQPQKPDVHKQQAHNTHISATSQSASKIQPQQLPQAFHVPLNSQPFLAEQSVTASTTAQRALNIDNRPAPRLVDNLNQTESQTNENSSSRVNDGDPDILEELKGKDQKYDGPNYFTREEDNTILQLREIQRMTWTDIANYLPGRNPSSICGRYTKVLRPSEATRRRWQITGPQYHFNDSQPMTPSNYPPYYHSIPGSQAGCFEGTPFSTSLGYNSVPRDSSHHLATSNEPLTTPFRVATPQEVSAYGHGQVQSTPSSANFRGHETASDTFRLGSHHRNRRDSDERERRPELPLLRRALQNNLHGQSNTIRYQDQETSKPIERGFRDEQLLPQRRPVTENFPSQATLLTDKPMLIPEPSKNSAMQRLHKDEPTKINEMISNDDRELQRMPNFNCNPGFQAKYRDEVVDLSVRGSPIEKAHTIGAGHSPHLSKVQEELLPSTEVNKFGRATNSRVVSLPLDVKSPRREPLPSALSIGSLVRDHDDAFGTDKASTNLNTTTTKAIATPGRVRGRPFNRLVLEEGSGEDSEHSSSSSANSPAQPPTKLIIHRSSGGSRNFGQAATSVRVVETPARRMGQDNSDDELA